MGIEILRLDTNEINDFSDLIQLFKVVFEWDSVASAGNDHLKKVLNSASFLVFVAKADKKIVGGLTAHVLDRYDSEKPSAYIYDIAVYPEFQRKGIGKRLISELNEYCEKSGFSEVYVQADTQDIEAVNFYKTTPISSELDVKHFTYSF